MRYNSQIKEDDYLEKENSKEIYFKTIQTKREVANALYHLTNISGMSTMLGMFWKLCR